MPNIKNKGRVLKAVREKCQVTCAGKSFRIMADFSTETLKVERTWIDVFQALKENNCQHRLPYATKLSFGIKEEIKTFQNKHKMREYVITKPAL